MATRYLSGDHSFADEEAVSFAASAARTADGAGDALDTDRGVARLTLDVTATEGNAETLDVTVQTRKDTNDSWRSVGTFTQATAVGSERKCFAGLDRLVRASWVIDSTLTISSVTANGGAGVLAASGTPDDAEVDSEYLVEITRAGDVGLSNGSVTVDVGNCTAVVPSGTPADTAKEAEFVVTITTQGGRGAGVFKWSDDGGETWTEDVTIDASGTNVLGSTGVSILFADETYDADDSMSWDVEGALFSWSNDDGSTYEEEDVVTSNAYDLGNGITLNFPDTGMTTDHSWTFEPEGQPSFTFSVTGELV
jgi:hypothetical protein